MRDEVNCALTRKKREIDIAEELTRIKNTLRHLQAREAKLIYELELLRQHNQT